MRRGQHSAVVSGAVATSPWIVVSSGVVVMVVLFVVAYCSAQGQGTEGEGGFHSADVAVSLTALPAEEDDPPPPTPEVVQRTPAPPVVPGLSPRSTDLKASKAAAEAEAEAEASRRAERPSPSPSTRPARPSARPDPAPPRSAVTGRYQVVGNWGDAFIGEVRLTNGGSSAESWSVRLVFPQGHLVTSWVESAEQGQARMTGGVFTYQGGVPIAPGGSAVLKFHLERTGSGTVPKKCSVNSSSCSGL